MVLDRVLYPYEAMLSFVNIGANLTLETASAMDPGFVRQSLRLTALEHPYLRMTIVPCATSHAKPSSLHLQFQEQEDTLYGQGYEDAEDDSSGTSTETSTPVMNSFVRFSVAQLPDDDLFTAAAGDASTGDREETAAHDAASVLLPPFQNRPRDFAKGLVHVKLLSNPSKTKHILLWSFNHAGIDGPGVLHVIASFFQYLHLALEGNHLSHPLVARHFVNVLSHIPEDAGERFPAPPMPPVGAFWMPNPVEDQQNLRDLRKRSEAIPKFPFITAFWSELTQAQTASLLANSRINNATVQGAVTAAGMLAIAKLMQGRFQFPVLYLNQVPINMRLRVIPPLGQGDAVCGSAGLWWQQWLDASTPIWDVAATATNSIHGTDATDQAFGWLHRIQTNASKLNPYTFMASSMGENPVGSVYKDSKTGSELLRIRRFRFMGGAYGESPLNTKGAMTHVHTFQGKLCTTVSYTPGYLAAFIEDYAVYQQKVLKALASSASKELTVEGLLAQL